MSRPAVSLPGSRPLVSPGGHSTEVETENGVAGKQPQDVQALERPQGASVRRGPCTCPEPSAVVRLRDAGTLAENVCRHRIP